MQDIDERGVHTFGYEGATTGKTSGVNPRSRREGFLQHIKGLLIGLTEALRIDIYHIVKIHDLSLHREKFLIFTEIGTRVDAPLDLCHIQHRNLLLLAQFHRL